MNNVISFTNYNRSWNLTEEATKRIFYPKNTNDIKKILKKIYSEKEKFLIKTGNCGHGDKTVLSNGKYVISLKNLNKIKKFNKRKKPIDLESGCYLFSVVKYLEKNVEFLDRTIRQISNRKFTIKNEIDWRKFTSGAIK